MLGPIRILRRLLRGPDKAQQHAQATQQPPFDPSGRPQAQLPTAPPPRLSPLEQTPAAAVAAREQERQGHSF